MDERHWDELSDAEREEVIAEVCRAIREGRFFGLSSFSLAGRHHWTAVRAIAADYEKRHPEIF